MLVPGKSLPHAGHCVVVASQHTALVVSRDFIRQTDIPFIVSPATDLHIIACMPCVRVGGVPTET